MKAITLWQPWATLVAVGAKKMETRSWPTSYRGPLAIHAAKTMQGWDVNGHYYLEILRRFGVTCGVYSVPYGKIVAVCRLADCVRTETLRPSALERRLGDFQPGRYAWILKDVRKLEKPIACRGAQGLWIPPAISGVTP